MIQHRLIAIDLTKAFAIFCVIMGHVLQWTFPGDPYAESCVFQFIYAFHMPLFMALSGYFIIRSFERPFLYFLKHRAVRLLLPVISFAVFYLPIKYIFNGLPDHLLQDITNYLLGGDLWFLKYLFVNSIIVYLSKRLLRNDLLALLPTILLFFFTRSGIFRLLPYVWLGYFLFKHEVWLSTHRRIVVITFGALFAFFLTAWHGSFDAPLRFLFLKPTWYFDAANTWAVFIRLGVGITGSTFFIQLFLMFEPFFRGWKVTAPLVSIGQHTLGIYALQLYILEHGLTDHLPMQLNLWWAIGAQFLIAIGVLIVCEWIARLMASNQITALLFLGTLPKTTLNNK